MAFQAKLVDRERLTMADLLTRYPKSNLYTITRIYSYLKLEYGGVAQAPFLKTRTIENREISTLFPFPNNNTDVRHNHFILGHVESTTSVVLPSMFPCYVSMLAVVATYVICGKDLSAMVLKPYWAVFQFHNIYRCFAT